MIQTYQITVLDREMNQNCTFALPFLPRIGDNIVLDDIAVTVLSLSIHASQITIVKGKDNSKIVTMNNQSTQNRSEDELITPVVALCDIQELDDKSENN